MATGQFTWLLHISPSLYSIIFFFKTFFHHINLLIPQKSQLSFFFPTFASLHNLFLRYPGGRRSRSHGFKCCIRKTPWKTDGNSLQDSCLGNPVDRGTWGHEESDIFLQLPLLWSMKPFSYMHTLFIILTLFIALLLTKRVTLTIM